MHREPQKAFAHHLPWQPRLNLLLALLATIAAGALLLLLPCARTPEMPADPLTALFTATSATCVTGLSVVDIGSSYSTFGQLLIMLLMQIGGIGIMTVTSFTFVALGHRLSVSDETLLATTISDGSSGSILQLLRTTILFAILFEIVGTLLLTRSHLQGGMPFWPALHQGAFHAISAFCNCGLSLYPDSLQSLVHNSTWLGTTSALVLLGGLGFLVLYNLSHFRFWQRNRHKRRRITAHTRMVLLMTLLLVASSTGAYLLFEWHHALADLGSGRKLAAALAQVISTRTAGFSYVTTTAQTEVTRHLSLLLMFIGGSPGSTAGGIKTTTLMVLFLTVTTIVRGRNSVLYGARAIPEMIVRQAIAILLLGLSFVAILFGLMLLIEAPSPGSSATMPLLFESVAAMSTAGLSLDLTSQISPPGRALLILAMLVGRIGPLSIVIAISRKRRTELIHYPEEEVVVG